MSSRAVEAAHRANVNIEFNKRATALAEQLGIQPMEPLPPAAKNLEQYTIRYLMIFSDFVLSCLEKMAEAADHAPAKAPSKTVKKPTAAKG
jgi:hypothetical protein